MFFWQSDDMVVIGQEGEGYVLQFKDVDLLQEGKIAMNGGL